MDKIRTTLLRLNPAHTALFMSYKAFIMGNRPQGKSKQEHFRRSNKDKQKSNKVFIKPGEQRKQCWLRAEGAYNNERPAFPQ